jgi:DNA-binding CsgD family transcriptional regulator
MPKSTQGNFSPDLTPGPLEKPSAIAGESASGNIPEIDSQITSATSTDLSQSSSDWHYEMAPNGDERLAMPRDVLLALNYGLELVRCGAMLVKGEGLLYFANRSAMEILRKRDGLVLARTGLVAERASDTRLLRQLLREAVTAPELGEPHGSPVTLPRKVARTSLIVRVLPGPELDCWPDKENRAALLTVYDEENSVQVDEAVLRKLYGLTRGEAALATVLLKGKSIDEAAEELFISPHTARTHLKRIFMKTDTHRQTELVIRIFSALS